MTSSLIPKNAPNMMKRVLSLNVVGFARQLAAANIKVVISQISLVVATPKISSPIYSVVAGAARVKVAIYKLRQISPLKKLSLAQL